LDRSQIGDQVSGVVTLEEKRRHVGVVSGFMADDAERALIEWNPLVAGKYQESWPPTAAAPANGRCIGRWPMRPAIVHRQNFPKDGPIPSRCRHLAELIP